MSPARRRCYGPTPCFERCRRTTYPALPAATACAHQILRDWSADGRVTKNYALPCYEEAIDALPTDIRDYTNAK